MTPLECTAVLPRLQAYHDDELGVTDQIAIAAHLDDCDICRESLEELEGVGHLLRSAAPGRTPLPCEEAASFTSTVINRIQVEERVSLVSTLRDLFEDRRVVYSALGATTATVACLVVMLTMMRFAGIERTDSLAGMMNVMKAPSAVSEPIVIRPVVVDARVMMPRALDSFSDGAVGDTVLALSGVVTSEGRVSNVEINDGIGGVAMASMDAKRLENLVEAVSKTRFEPVMKEGAPVAVNMVWFVAHTTVRGVARKRLTAHVPRVGVIHRV
jgi:Putative zinc-finger